MYFNIAEKAYWVEEHGDGYPIVLLHGFTGSSKSWDYYVGIWKDNYKVITIDLPGHGNTKVNQVVHMEEFCDDLHTILSRLHLKQVTLIGYSLGGRTALSFAMMYPNLVSSLVLESASPGLKSSQEQIARQMKDDGLANKIETEGLAVFIDFWEQIPLFQTQKTLSDLTKAKVRQERLNQSESGLALSLRGMGTGVQPSWWEQLPEASLPVLLIVGEFDNKFIDIAKRMNDRMKTSELEIIPNAGHNIHLEQHQKFTELVVEFLKKIEM